MVTPPGAGPTRAAYAGAIAVAAAAVFITSMVPVLRERTTFLMALGVITVSAGKYGWRVGAAAAMTAALLIGVMIPPDAGWFSRGGEELLRFGTFAMMAAALLLFARARESSEARLWRTQALAQVIVDNGPVLIAGADAAGNTVMFNRACELLTGYTRDEVIGKPFIQTFVPESWQSRVAARFVEEPIEVLERPHENPWRTKGSDERLIEWRCFRVVRHDGSPITMGIGQDVTDRHRAQEAIEVSLARETAARKALDDANARKEQFIALLAHELRTPLNAAMGWFHILRTGKPEDAAHRASDAVDRNLRVMHDLIEDVVDFNRAEFGKLTLNRTAVDIGNLLGDVGLSARAIAEARAVSLELSVSAELPPIQADPKRLRQVMLNVVGNAVKFTNPGGRVTVAAREERRDVVIAVADDGAGIDPEHLERIFDPMWKQGGGERSDGLGLGLALVKRLVEAHGGEVTITSAGLGRGTEVVVRLPVEDARESRATG